MKKPVEEVCVDGVHYNADQVRSLVKENARQKARILILEQKAYGRREQVSEINTYIDGMYYCYKGWDAPEDASEAFLKGYAAQYELEAIRTHRSEHEHHRTA